MNYEAAVKLYWDSIIGYSIMYFVLIIIGFLAIYKWFGWKGFKIYFAVIFGYPLIGALINTNYGAPDASGFYVAHAFTFGIFMLVFAVIGYLGNKRKDEYRQYIEEKIRATGGPTDEELLKIKRKMGYDRSNPNYEKMNGYLEREELTRRWRLSKEREFADPMWWIGKKQ